MASQANSEPRAARGRRPLALALAAVVLVAVLVVAGRSLAGAIPALAERIDGLGAWGPVAFACVYAAATVAFAPGSILTLLAGAIFGIARGTVIVFAGATTGAALAFLVARHLARSAIENKVARHPRFAAIDRAIGEQGGRIVFLLRLSPVFPFNLLNYALGLTKVRFADYVVASVGMIPGTLLYVYYGQAIGDVAALASGARVARGVGYYAVLGIGLVATVVVTTLVTRLARRALGDIAGDGGGGAA